jgi:predicted glycosyltransferase
MNILIDIGHPAHVHLFRHLIAELREQGIPPLVTVKDLPSATQLLDNFGIPYTCIGSKSDSLRGKIAKQVLFDKILYRLVKRHRIDLAVGTSMTIAHVSRLTKMKSIVLDDDDGAVQPLFVKFAHPFADVLMSPDVLAAERGKPGHVVYPGYHELAYLHPKRFTPDPEVPKKAGIREGESYFVMRFNAFKAHHDRGVHGLSFEQKMELIRLLEPHGKIFITTEGEIVPQLKKYQLTVPPEEAHSLLHYASMFVGDSQTMTSEAAVLGTPALKCNSLAGRLSVANQLEDIYNMSFAFQPDDYPLMKTKVKELLAMADAKKEWALRKEAMLRDKIDVTAFISWFVRNFPRSLEEYRTDSELFKRFH